MDRDRLHRNFMEDPQNFVKQAKAAGESLHGYMNRISPEPMSGFSDDAMGHILQKEELRITGTPTAPSASVEDFTKNEARRELFWSTLDRDYDKTSSIHDLQVKATNTDAALTDNTPFKVRDTSPMVERNRFQPRLRIADIASRVETIAGTTWQVPEYQTGENNEQSAVIAEATRIPTTTVTTGTETGRTDKIGAGLRISDEYQLNALNMETIRMWVRRVAMRDEITIVNEGVAILAANAGASIATLSTLSLKDIIDVNLYGNGGYQYNTLVSTRTGAASWITANVQSLGGNNTGPLLDGSSQSFGSAIAPIQLINSTYGPTRLGFVDDGAVTGLANAELLGVDQRFALVLKRTQRSQTDETQRISSHQVTERYLTQRYGWDLEDPSAVVQWTMTLL